MGRLTTRVEKLEGIQARRASRSIDDLTETELEERIAAVRQQIIDQGGNPDAMIAEAEASGLAMRRHRRTGAGDQSGILNRNFTPRPPANPYSRSQLADERVWSQDIRLQLLG